MKRTYKTRSPIHRPTRRMTSNEERERDRPTAKVQARLEIDSELSDLLDEIDALLVENAEEFVTQYVQQGGE